MSETEKKPRVLINSFTDENVVKAIKELEKIESEYSSNQEVLLQIDSNGGSAHGMAMLYNHVKSMQNPIVTYTASRAMSAGAIMLSTLGDKGKRIASPNATIMVHEIQAGAIGDIKDIEDTVKYLKTLNNHWQTLLAKSMGLKNHKDVRKLIAEKAIGQDVYLTAHQAKALGLVDEVGIIKMTPISLWVTNIIK